MKKLFSNYPYSRALVEANQLGTYTDDQGTKWDVWHPTGNTGSSFYRLECPGRRTQFVYSPCHRFQFDRA